MFLTILLILLSAYSQHTIANTDTHANELHAKWLTGLPSLCLDHDFHSRDEDSDEFFHQQIFTKANPGFMRFRQDDLDSFSTRGNERRTFKKMIKKYVYDVAKQKLDLDIKTFTEFRINPYFRLELEPRFTSRGKFESIYLNALILDRL